MPRVSTVNQVLLLIRTIIAITLITIAFIHVNNRSAVFEGLDI